MPQSSHGTISRRRIALGLLALGGCAGQGTTRTGFLTSYDDMAPTPEHTHDLIFVAPGYARARYRRIIVDPVVWYPAADSPERNEDEIEQLRDAFRASLIEALQKAFTIAPPGPAPAEAGTLRVRAAITNTRRANWWINVPVQAAGIGLVAVGIPGGMPPPNPGGASVEMEVVDAATGERLASIATYANGAPWAPMGYVSRFGHARRAFRLAATLLQQQLAPGKPDGQGA